MRYQAEVRKVEEQEGHRMELDGTESLLIVLIGVPLTDWNRKWISLSEWWDDFLINLMNSLSSEKGWKS